MPNIYGEDTTIAWNHKHTLSGPDGGTKTRYFTPQQLSDLAIEEVKDGFENGYLGPETTVAIVQTVDHELAVIPSFAGANTFKVYEIRAMSGEIAKADFPPIHELCTGGGFVPLPPAADVAAMLGLPPFELTASDAPEEDDDIAR